MIQQDHVTKESSNYMGESYLRKVTILLSLVAISVAVLEIQMILVCHVMLQDNVIKRIM